MNFVMKQAMGGMTCINVIYWLPTNTATSAISVISFTPNPNTYPNTNPNPNSNPTYNPC